MTTSLQENNRFVPSNINQVRQAIAEIEQTEKRLSGTKQIYQAIIDFHNSNVYLWKALREFFHNIDGDDHKAIERLLLFEFLDIRLLERRISIDILHCWIEEHLACQTYQEREEQKELLREMPYPEYLQTDHWKLTREFKIHQANDRCQVCNAFGVQLNVHHRTYERRGCEIDADLIVLCQECHEIFHTHGKLAKQD